MDKEKIHIDDEFLDQSWAAMSQLLDEEMPVKEKRRRFIWLWFFGVGMLVLGISIVYFQSLTPTTTSPIPSEKVAQTEVPSKLSTDQSSVKTATASEKKQPETTIITDVNQKESLDNFTQSQVPKNPTSIRSSTAKRTVAAVETDFSKETANNIPSSRNPLTNPNPTTPTAKENKKLSSTTPLLDSNNDRFSTDFLPMVSIRKFPSTFTTLEVTPKPASKPNRWHFGLYAATVFPEQGGFALGLQTNYQLGKRWSLLMGLGYAKRIDRTQSQRRNAESDFGIASTVEDPMEPETEIAEADSTFSTSAPSVDVDNTGSGGENTSETTMAPTNISQQIVDFESFHYIELPISIQYQVGPRWSFHVGGRIARLHGFRYTTFEESNFSRDLSAFSQQTTNIRTDDSVDNLNVHRWDIAAMGGIGYRFSPKLQTYLQYNHGFTDYLTSTNSEAKKWRQFELGIRYYFK
ncbi:MAG: outer membrane beta-barrel protein [Bacteroidota bacterium]